MTSNSCAEIRVERFLILTCLMVVCYCLVQSFMPTRNVSPHQFKISEHINRKLPDRALIEYESLLRESEYYERVMHIQQVCSNNFVANLSKLLTYHSARKQRFKKRRYCNAKECPLIIDEKKKFMLCFIPKVASTEIKELMLNVSEIPVNESVTDDSSSLHDFANHALPRISPFQSSSKSSKQYFKAIFVRHPFDRLVSAFRSKAETPRKQNSFFYKTYWDKIMRLYRRNYAIDEKSRITFQEFVRYLIHTIPWSYDDHWAPYWSRCNPCRVDYNFIGKLESSSFDFPYAFRKMGIKSFPDKWSNRDYTIQHSITLDYFSQIPRDYIIKLYNIYWLDFEFFDYTLDEFL